MQIVAANTRSMSAQAVEQVAAAMEVCRELAGLAGASLQSWHPTPATDVLLPPLPGPPHLQEKANVKDAKKDKKAERVRQ